jgi:hypothetical protein
MLVGKEGGYMKYIFDIGWEDYIEFTNPRDAQNFIDNYTEHTDNYIKLHKITEGEVWFICEHY